MAEAASLFTSPAKRRRTCGAVEPDEAVFTKAGAFKAAARLHDDGLLSEEPDQALPPSLLLLNQLLGALYVTMPLLRARGKPTTYINLRTPVQNFTGRDFTIEHVQQIKAVMPESLIWEHTLASAPGSTKPEQQLLLRMPDAAGKSGADAAAVQQRFFACLQRLAADARKTGSTGNDIKPPRAQLPPLAAPSARDCTPGRRSGSSALPLPGTPQTAPPPGRGTVARSGNATALLMSPPPKRGAATVARVPAGAAGMCAAGLMSPPPTRTRASRLRQEQQQDCTAAAPGASPGPNAVRAQLLSPEPSSVAQRVRSSLFNTPKTRGGKEEHAVDDVDHTPVRTAAAEFAADTPGGTATPALRPSRLFAATPPAARTPLVQDDDGGAPHHGAATVVEQEEDRHHLTPQAAAAAASASAAPSGTAKGRKLTFADAPAARTRSGLTFELGASAMALLQRVSSAEACAERAAVAEQLDARRALDMLPSSFDVLRAVFGERGLCVRPKDEVLTLLRQKSTLPGGMSPADAAEQLELLLRLIPEFVRTCHAPGQALAAMATSVRINRQMSWGAARGRLLAEAASARNHGLDAAAAAVKAEVEREEAAEGSNDCSEAVAAASMATRGASDSEVVVAGVGGSAASAQDGDGDRAGDAPSKGAASTRAAAAAAPAADLAGEVEALLLGGGSSSRSSSMPGSPVADALLGCMALRPPLRSARVSGAAPPTGRAANA